jgi:hypothetical protein
VQQGPQQQTRWASAHNDHLGAHSVCHAKLSSNEKRIGTSMANDFGQEIFGAVVLRVIKKGLR